MNVKELVNQSIEIKVSDIIKMGNTIYHDDNKTCFVMDADRSIGEIMILQTILVMLNSTITDIKGFEWVSNDEIKTDVEVKTNLSWDVYMELYKEIIDNM